MDARRFLKVPQEGHKHVLNQTEDQPFFSLAQKPGAIVRKSLCAADEAHDRNHVRPSRGSAARLAARISKPSMYVGGAGHGDYIASGGDVSRFFGNPGHTVDEARGSSVQ